VRKRPSRAQRCLVRVSLLSGGGSFYIGHILTPSYRGIFTRVDASPISCLVSRIVE